MTKQNRPPIDLKLKYGDISQQQAENDLLELVNCISDRPVPSLKADNAFEPLLMILFSEPYFMPRRFGRTLNFHVLSAEFLLNFGESAYQPLISYLDNLNPGLRRKEILRLLALHGDVQIFDGLANLYQSRNVRGIQPELVKALIHLNKDKAADLFSEVMFTGRNSFIRTSATLALGDCLSEFALLPLVAMLRDEDIHVVISAITALKKLKLKSAIPFLIDSSTDYRALTRSLRFNGKDITIAQHAIRALSEYDTPETDRIVFQWCTAHLDFAEIHIIDWTVKFLVEKKDPRAIPHLIKLIEDNRERSFIWSIIRRTALRGLNEIGTPLAIEAYNRLNTKRPLR